MTSTIRAFMELMEAVREEQPYVLGRDRWHIDAPAGVLCRTRADCWIRGDDRSVIASEIDICRTCSRRQEVMAPECRSSSTVTPTPTTTASHDDATAAANSSPSTPTTAPPADRPPTPP